MRCLAEAGHTDSRFGFGDEVFALTGAHLDAERHAQSTDRVVQPEAKARLRMMLGGTFAHAPHAAAWARIASLVGAIGNPD